MGGSLARGLIRQGVCAPDCLTISDPSEAVLESFDAMDVNTGTDNVAAIKGADIIFVVVKPWLTVRVLQEIAPSIDPEHQTLAVIAASVVPEELMEAAPEIDLVLAIPNIAVEQGNSMTFLSSVWDQRGGLNAIRSLFDLLGQTMTVPVSLLPAGTTLASCGIAYAMRYVRAAMEGGVEIGFKASDAEKVVLQTLKGAVSLLEDTGMHPEAAIDQVTTPGGLTIKGLNEMEEAGFTASVIRGLIAGMR